MTIKTLTLRNSGYKIHVDVDDVALFQEREWGTILNFGLELGEGRLDTLEVRERCEEVMDKSWKPVIALTGDGSSDGFTRM
jgi:hypothetical protein